jgi:hypothetical protein
MEPIKIIDDSIIDEENRATTCFDKARLMDSINALEKQQFNELFHHIVSLQHFFTRFSTGFWTDEERFLNPAEVGKNVIRLDKSFL